MCVGHLSRTGPQAIVPGLLAKLWERTDLPLGERTLWRLLREPAAGVRQVLSLNVEQLDLAERRPAPADLCPDIGRGLRAHPEPRSR